jgi:hypothetical protein
MIGAEVGHNPTNFKKKDLKKSTNSIKHVLISVNDKCMHDVTEKDNKHDGKDASKNIKATVKSKAKTTKEKHKKHYHWCENRNPLIKWEPHKLTIINHCKDKVNDKEKLKGFKHWIRLRKGKKKQSHHF